MSDLAELAAGNVYLAVGADARVTALPTPWTYALQADPTDAEWRAAVAAATGVAPPMSVGGVAEDGAARVYCLGPDAWLLTSEAEIGEAALTDALQSFEHSAAVEVTEARAWCAMEGPGAAAALAKLSTVDMSASVFPAGTCRGLQLGPLAAIVERQSAERFIVAGHASTAEFLSAMLARAIGAEEAL
jgi:heterotetrameric sarcosine oxidase gamma subunit